MSLLAGISYDPATAVTKSAGSLLAMTALDTTNLRVSFVCPSNGRVEVRIRGVLHGAAGVPGILTGVLDGSTVRARGVPDMSTPGTLAATTRVPFESLVPVVGLTSGQTYTWDAAYGVEVLLGSSAIKYGGPNNTTTDDAFGAIVFEVWDTL